MEIERGPESYKAENEDIINFAPLSLLGDISHLPEKLLKRVHERVSFLTQTRHSLSLGGIQGRKGRF